MHTVCIVVTKNIIIITENYRRWTEFKCVETIKQIVIIIVITKDLNKYFCAEQATLFKVSFGFKILVKRTLKVSHSKLALALES